MRTNDLSVGKRMGRRTWAVLALLLVACRPPPPAEEPPPTEPGPRLYVSDYSTLQTAVFDTSRHESEPVGQIGVPLTTVFPRVALDTAHDQFAVATTQGIRFYSRGADGPPQAVRTIPFAFKLPLHIAASAEKNLLTVIDLSYTIPTSPFGPRDVLADVYVFPLDASGPTEPLWVTSWSELTGSGRTVCRPVIDFERGEIFTCMAHPSRVNVYPLAGNGRVSPVRVMEFDSMVTPLALALDTRNGLLYAASESQKAVLVYDSSASGEVAPLRTFEGVHARDIAVDPEHGELVAILWPGDRLSVYPSSGSGAVEPLRSFATVGTQVVVDPAREEVIVGGGSRLSTYSRQTTGEGTPLRRLWDEGPSYPTGVAVNPVERTLCVVHAGGFVETYPLSGGPPVRTLRGPQTRLETSRALAVAPVRGELFVSNWSTITVYPVGASGDVAPSRVIAGPDTGLYSPWGLAVDELHGELYVAESGANAIHVYALDANGNVRPKRTISGADAQLRGPRGMALDLVHDELLVSNYEGTVTAYPRLGEGSVAPLRSLGTGGRGTRGAINFPTALTYDPVRDEVYVASVGEGRVHVFSRLATDLTPALRSFSSGLKTPAGVALAYE
jgi:DNA-binding beta-propeller fold protein YncE